MRNPLQISLALVATAITLGALFWLLGVGAVAPPPAEVLGLAPGATAAPGKIKFTGLRPQPEDLGAAQVQIPAPEVEREIQIEPAGDIARPEDVYFGEKYRGVSAQGLTVAAAAVHAQFLSEQSRIIKEKLANGDYDVSFVAPGTKAPPLISTSASQPRVSFGGEATPRSDGLTEVHTAVIQLGEYPEFDLLALEDIWLSRSVGGQK